ncbi:hypothetical protein ACNYS0_20870 [Streptomyces sp. BH034]|uniref:hypothetical protein n=1 Tax=Streptomyces sp. BH034 TaxID=3402626 RepID=UPI003BB4942B
MSRRTVLAAAALTMTAVFAGATAASADAGPIDGPKPPQPSGLIGAHPANVNDLDGHLADLGAKTADEAGAAGDLDLLGGIL